MKPKELKAIREAMGLTQEELGVRLGVTRNSAARLERGEQAITPSMALLIGYVAREAGVEATASHSRRSSGVTQDKREQRAGTRASGGKGRHG